MAIRHIHPSKLKGLEGSKNFRKSNYSRFGKDKLIALRDIEQKFKLIYALENDRSIESDQLKIQTYAEIESIIRENIFSVVYSSDDVESKFQNIISKIINGLIVDIEELEYISSRLDVSIDQIIDKLNLIAFSEEGD